MDDVMGVGSGRTPRKVEMGVQTTMTLQDLKNMEVNTFVVRDHISKMKEKVDSIKKKDLKVLKVTPPPKVTEDVKPAPLFTIQRETPIKTSSYFQSKGEVPKSNTG